MILNMFKKTQCIERLFKDVKSMCSVTPVIFGGERRFQKQDTNDNKRHFIKLDP